VDGVSRVVNEELLVLVEFECVDRRLAKLFADHQDGLASWLALRSSRQGGRARLMMPALQDRLFLPSSAKIPLLPPCPQLVVDGRNCASKRALSNNK